MSNNNFIKSFKDLEVYQHTYKIMLIVMKVILPKLPESEKYDLKDQISRACKSIRRLIAKGYAKRHQKAGFQKYLDDAMAECNEMILSLEQVKDLYDIEPVSITVKELINLYDKSARQLYKLSSAWANFKNKNSKR